MGLAGSWGQSSGGCGSLLHREEAQHRVTEPKKCAEGIQVENRPNTGFRVKGNVGGKRQCRVLEPKWHPHGDLVRETGIERMDIYKGITHINKYIKGKGSQLSHCW